MPGTRGLWLLPRDIGRAALLCEGEMLDHGVACPDSIFFLDGLEDTAVVVEEQVVIFTGKASTLA